MFSSASRSHGMQHWQCSLLIFIDSSLIKQYSSRNLQQELPLPHRSLRRRWRRLCLMRSSWTSCGKGFMGKMHWCLSASRRWLIAMSCWIPAWAVSTLCGITTLWFLSKRAWASLKVCAGASCTSSVKICLCLQMKQLTLMFGKSLTTMDHVSSPRLVSWFLIFTSSCKYKCTLQTYMYIMYICSSNLVYYTLHQASLFKAVCENSAETTLKSCFWK